VRPVGALTIDVPDEEALRPLAQRLLASLPRGGCLALTGDLGAGKTTFVKAFAAAAGIDPTEVVSPTFGLIHVHDGPRGRLLHADMYRLRDVAELHETGWTDAVTDADWTCVEWPERIAAALPPERIDVAITITGPNSRRFLFTGHGSAHDHAVAVLAPPTPPGRGLG